MTPTGRRIPGDWHDGVVPANVDVSAAALIETTYSFHEFRSVRRDAIRIGRGASVYSGTMFDLGPDARLAMGDYVMLNSPRIICDASIEIGDYTLISWNAVLMDTYRVPVDPLRRRERVANRSAQSHLPDDGLTRRIVIGRNVWIGFEACVLPGVTIGEGAIVGTRSVVVADVPPYTVAAGNPARIVRTLDPRA